MAPTVSKSYNNLVQQASHESIFSKVPPCDTSAVPVVAVQPPSPSMLEHPLSSLHHSNSPVHLFAQTRNATYTLPHSQNFGAPRPAALKDIAHCTQAPVQSSKIADDVYTRSLQIHFSITQEELLLLSLEV